MRSSTMLKWDGQKGVLTRSFRLVCAMPFGIGDVACEVDMEWEQALTELLPGQYAYQHGWQKSRCYGWLCPACAVRVKAGVSSRKKAK